MPQTAKQSIVFTLMTVFFMVYCMTVYTIVLKMGGLTGPVFSMALCLQVFFVGPLVRWIFRNMMRITGKSKA